MRKSFWILATLLPLLWVSCKKDPKGDPKPTDSTWTETTSWVDMGTGVLWAARNLRAANEFEPGAYFAWGCTDCPKAGFYSWENYSHCNVKNGKPVFTKYNAAGNQALLPEDDIASLISEGRCRIPTPGEFIELLDHCNWEWIEGYVIPELGITAQDGWGDPVNGYLCTSPSTGNQLFFPACGTGSDNGGVYYPGKMAGFWTDTQDADDKALAKCFLFNKPENQFGLSDMERCTGLCIRPVRAAE